MLPKSKKHSHLFMLRLWAREDEDGRVQWRGQLRHINNNEVRYFQDWPALIPLLLTMLRAPRPLPENNDDPLTATTEEDQEK